MPNLLLDPNNWQSFSSFTGGGWLGPPSAFWDEATSSYFYYGDEFSYTEEEMRLITEPVPGDTIEGEFEALTTYVSGVPSLKLLDADGTLIDTVPGEIGVLVPFSFSAVTGARLVTAKVGDFAYSGEARIHVPAPPPQSVSYNCECDDEYPTKTLAQMREYLMIRLGWGAMVSTPLPGVAVTLNSFLRDAQEQIYRQYKVFRLERFFTWPLLTGVRFYDLPDNEDVCTKKIDPRMITWVGISEGDNFWRQLVCGIKPEFYYGDISSWPTHYEIRQCIEVWPPPSSDDWKLRIKGYFGLLPLEVDTDVNTIDYEAIQLFALANAKAHYGHPDAANYMGQYRDYIGAVTAGSHHTRRYVPNTEQSYPPPLPILTGYPGDP